MYPSRNRISLAVPLIDKNADTTAGRGESTDDEQTFLQRSISRQVVHTVVRDCGKLTLEDFEYLEMSFVNAATLCMRCVSRISSSFDFARFWNVASFASARASTRSSRTESRKNSVLHSSSHSKPRIPSPVAKKGVPVSTHVKTLLETPVPPTTIGNIASVVSRRIVAISMTCPSTRKDMPRSCRFEVSQLEKIVFHFSSPTTTSSQPTVSKFKKTSSAAYTSA